MSDSIVKVIPVRFAAAQLAILEEFAGDETLAAVIRDAAVAHCAKKLGKPVPEVEIKRGRPAASEEKPAKPKATKKGGGKTKAPKAKTSPKSKPRASKAKSATKPSAKVKSAKPQPVKKAARKSSKKAPAKKAKRKAS